MKQPLKHLRMTCWLATVFCPPMAACNNFVGKRSTKTDGREKKRLRYCWKLTRSCHGGNSHHGRQCKTSPPITSHSGRAVTRRRSFKCNKIGKEYLGTKNNSFCTSPHTLYVLCQDVPAPKAGKNIMFDVRNS